MESVIVVLCLVSVIGLTISNGCQIHKRRMAENQLACEREHRLKIDKQKDDEISLLLQRIPPTVADLEHFQHGHAPVK